MCMRQMGTTRITARIAVVAMVALSSGMPALATDDIDALNQQVVQLHGQGKYKEARAIAERTLVVAEQTLGPQHPDTLASINNLAELCRAQGDYSGAEAFLRRALAGYERALGPEHPDTLASVNNLGALYQEQGRHGEAEPFLKRALAAWEKALGPEHPDTLAGLNNLAVVYLAQGRDDEAEPFLKRVLAGREKALGPEHPDTFRSVNNLAALYRTLGRYGEAEPLLKRALASREKALGPEHPDTLLSINNLGALYQEQGRYPEAEPFLKRALAGWEHSLGAEHPDTVLSINNLAALYFKQRDWLRAVTLWRRSTTTIATRTLRGAQTVDQALTGKKKSEAERSLGQFRHLVQAVYRLAPGGSMPDAASSREMFQTAQWALNSEAAQSLAQMAARSAKGDGALAALVRERQDLVVEWQERELLRNAALGQEAAKRIAGVEAENNAQMAAIDTRIAAIDRRLKADFPDYAGLASPEPHSVEEVQAQLGANEVLVLFLSTPDWQPGLAETFIWVVTKSEVRWVRSNLGSYVLTEEVQALRCGLDYAAWNGSRCKELTGVEYAQADYFAGKLLPFDHARAHKLYKALFGNVEDLIKDKHLLIVPSGALTQLPFQVLVTSLPANSDHGSATWLTRSHAITVLPAASSLKALRHTGRPSAAPKPLIGFGNPLLDGPDARYAKAAKLAREKQSCPNSPWQRVASLFRLRGGAAALQTRGELANVSLIRKQPPLPETADELCAVARDSGADVSEVRLGAKATEREVKAASARGELAQYRIVHFATHGAMAGELSEGVEPGLILTPPNTASENDDGYLTASEIATLKLDADWVILSACNTAAGDTANAEALSGLSRAFIYAQARALLVSHWAVDSDATVKLVTAAIREIVRDKSVGRSEALRRAMLALIDKGKPHEAHPAYWAPFIVVGEGSR
jgi:CHAT domain-containing protein/Tfp pilus assembly protein PilF